MERGRSQRAGLRHHACRSSVTTTVAVAHLDQRAGNRSIGTKDAPRDGRAPAKAGSLHGRLSAVRPSDVERLSFIRQARDLGFRLDAVRRLLGPADRKVNTCGAVREVEVAHLAEVRAKIAVLSRMERVLSDLVRSCRGSTVPQCLLLEALAVPKWPQTDGAAVSLSLGGDGHVMLDGDR
ncbi:MerR family DNA-binding protein [Reyranella sp.]